MNGLRITGLLLFFVALESAASAHAGDPGPDRGAGAVELLVAPGGSAFEVPVRVGEICILTFPDELTMSAVKSSELFEVNAWNKDSVAVRALPKATSATLAIVTKSGAIKVNLTLRVAASGEAALTLVRFRAVSAEEALEARVRAEVAKRAAPIIDKLAAERAQLEDVLRERTARAISEAALARAEVVALSAHGRNDHHVIVHVERALLLGGNAYVFFEIENRSASPYRVTSVLLRSGKATVGSSAVLRAATPDRDPSVLGVVRAETTLLGVITIPGATKLRKAPLSLTVSDTTGRGTIELSRGIGLP